MGAQDLGIDCGKKLGFKGTQEVYDVKDFSPDLVVLGRRENSFCGAFFCV